MPVKVECESCKAPYTIDERRIPAAGLRVRCPKCAKTFVIKKPSDAEAAPPPPSPPPSDLDLDLPAVPQARTAPIGGRRPAATIAFAGAPGALPGAPSVPSFANKPIAAPPKPAAPAPPPDDLELDLPVPVRAPTAKATAPAAPQARPVPAPPTPAAPAAPTAPATAAVGRAALKGTQVGLGAFLPKVAGPTTPTTSVDDFPAMRGNEVPAPPADLGDDLPAPRNAPPAKKESFDDLELPSPVARAAPAATRKPTPGADLPLPKAPRGGDAFGDLPATRGADLPSPRAASHGADLPAPRGLGVADLPATRGPGVDLPATRGRPGPPPRPQAPKAVDFGDIDLPSVSSGADLPARRGHDAFGELDLPDVAGVGLPEVQSAGLPALQTAGLPSPTIQGPGLPMPMSPSAQTGMGRPGIIDLPTVAAPTAHLPAVAGGGASMTPRAANPSGSFEGLGTAQTAVGAAFPSQSQSHQSIPAPGGFGELELPGPSGPPPPDQGSAPDLGLRAGTPHGFGELDFEAPPAKPASSTSSGMGFGELDLGSPGPDFGASSGASTRSGGDHGGFDADPLAGLGEPARGADKSNMGFGEVDLGGGSPAGEDDMEFGAIPQAGGSGAGSEFSPDSRGFGEAPLPRPRTATTADEAKPKKPSRIGRYVLGFFAIAALAGAGLEFTKHGAFFRNDVVDRLNGEKYASTTTTAITRTRQAFGEDIGTKAAEAVRTLDQDVDGAPRYAPLLAFAAYANFAQQLRFGKDATLDAKGRRLLERVALDVPAKKLAEATRDVVAGQPGSARATLQSLVSGEFKIEATVTLGELELREKKGKEAVAAWTQAKAAEDSARTRTGLMRAYDLSADYEKAKKEAVDLAKKFPKNVSSRLLLARYAWDQAKDEKEALRWLDELKKPDIAGTASPQDLVDAGTLRGNLLLERGRVTDARAAFEAAVAAAKGLPTPLAQLGLGEVDMAAGQYASAIAHFNAASQAMPELTQAKIGVARAKLKQEIPAEAKSVLSPLKDPKFAGEIGFWLGQAEEKLSPDKPGEAMKIYEGAIKAQPSEPKAYIALAKLQAKVGRTEDAASTLAQALKAVPPSDKLHLAVGQLKYSQSKYEDALAEYEQALTIQPENLEALFEKGRALLRTGPKGLEDGKSVLDQVEKKDPKYPNLALEMGFYYLHTNQLAEALKRYQGALDAAPNDIDVKLNVGIAMVESNNPDAEQTLRDVLDKCPTGSTSPDFCITETRHYLGRALLNRGAVTDAVVFLKQAVEKSDSNANYHLYFGWALEEAQRFDDAELEINRTLELDKSKSEAYWLRGEILARKGMFKDAIDTATIALKQNPSIYAAHATIAFSMKSLGQETDSIGEFRKAIDGDPRNPQSPWWRYQIADIYYHQAATTKAAAEIKECVAQASSKDPAPSWLPKAYFYLGESVRYTDKEEAKKAYRTYLEKSVGGSDPARGEARAALAELGAPYVGP